MSSLYIHVSYVSLFYFSLLFSSDIFHFIVKDPQAMQEWMDERRSEFDSLSEDN